MFSASSLLTTLTLALVVAANPLVIDDQLITLSIAKRVNSTGSAFTLHQLDKARAQHLKRVGAARTGGVVSDATVASIPATNAVVSYTVNVRGDI